MLQYDEVVNQFTERQLCSVVRGITVNHRQCFQLHILSRLVVRTTENAGAGFTAEPHKRYTGGGGGGGDMCTAVCEAKRKGGRERAERRAE